MQSLLDGFYYVRRFVVNCIAYLSLKLYALEITFNDVKQGRYDVEQHENRDLNDAKDLDDLLATAKDCYKAAIDRRTIVTDKCKTLLTLSAFILTISGLFLPKSFEFDGWCMRVLFFVAGILVLDAVILLLV